MTQTDANDIGAAQAAGLMLLAGLLAISVLVPPAAIVAAALLGLTVVGIIVVDRRVVETQLPARGRWMLHGLAAGCLAAGALGLAVNPVIPSAALGALTILAALRLAADGIQAQLGWGDTT